MRKGVICSLAADVSTAYFLLRVESEQRGAVGWELRLQKHGISSQWEFSLCCDYHRK